MKRFMRKPQINRHLLLGKKNKRDDRGSAIVIVIIAMALIGILASTILWASYLNYRIKINDLKVKNSFYSAETVVEQILAGVKKNVVSVSVNEAYQEVVSNWDALATDDNRESYFITAYVEAVERHLGAAPTGEANKYAYDKDILRGYVDDAFWTEGNADGYIVEETWENADPVFKTAFELDESGSTAVKNMSIKNICIEFYDSNDLLSIINTDIAIDVPKLRFTQAGTVDRLYPYVLVGDTGIVTADGINADIKGSIYGGVDDDDKGGIQIGKKSTMTVENASYIISGGDILIGSDSTTNKLVQPDAKLIVRDKSSGGVGFQTSVYAKGLAVNGSRLDISGKTYIANDLLLSGSGSYVTLTGQYFGYGNTRETTKPVSQADGSTKYLNPAETSSAIVINGKDATVDLTGLNTLQLAGRAYMSLSDDNDDDGAPHVLMGESISVKSNQIAYLVPAECVGTLDGRTIIGQNPMTKDAWERMMDAISEYAENDSEENPQKFRIVDATVHETVKLGGLKLFDFGIKDLSTDDLSMDDLTNIVTSRVDLNKAAAKSNVRFVYTNRDQIYMYLIMEQDDAERYFAAYYNVNSNKISLNNYFNQYASGGIKLKENVQGYTVLGNSMVSQTSAASGDNIQTSTEGNLVRLLSSVLPSEDDEEGDEEQAKDPDVYEEVSDNVTSVENVKSLSELDDLIEQVEDIYDNLNKNLLEDDAGLEDTVFKNLVRAESADPVNPVTGGLKEYFDAYAPGDRIVTFEAADGVKQAVLVDCSRQSGNKYVVKDSDIHLVIALGDVEVKCNFKGLILASGTITIAENVTCENDGESVYDVLQAASNKTDAEGNPDPYVPADFLYNGKGMIMGDYEEADVDENGNLNINYSEIVRYENWIKK